MKVQFNKEASLDLIRKLFCFSGRATRREYWSTVLLLAAFGIVVGVVTGVLSGILGSLCDWLGMVVTVLLFVPSLVAIVIAGIAAYIRRLHDLGLSGFWMFYLTPMGLTFLYVANILDVDESAKRSISRIKDVGSPWLSWILAFILWPMGFFFGTCFVLLCPGQRTDNLYGTNPYPAE